VSDALGGSRIARIVCIPYFPDDVVNAIVLHDIFNAPLCTYLMDDQNILCDGIPDALMSELLEKSTLRLAISPEMCQAYEHKFGHRFWLVPPLAPRQFIPHEVNYAGSVRPNQGIIIGNIWGKRWTELLCETVRGSGVTLDWYSSRGDVAAFTDEELARDGIVVHERRADAELTPILRRYAFAVVPSGTLDEADDRRFIAQLSLPSRITYTMATSHTPMLVLGSPDTVAARFVTRTGIGLSAPYDPRGFQGVVDRITEPETNRRMREAAFRLAPKYSDQGAAQWIWDSLARGGPVDDRYQERGS
jgi:hypothetical protein